MAGVIGILSFQAWVLERLVTDGAMNIKLAFTLESLLFLLIGFGVLRLYRHYIRPTSFVAEQLSERELEVFKALITGQTNSQIMEALFIEKSTLKSHINRIYKKLNISNRDELKRRYT